MSTSPDIQKWAVFQQNRQAYFFKQNERKNGLNWVENTLAMAVLLLKIFTNG